MTPEEILGEFERAIRLLLGLMEGEGRRRGQGSPFKTMTVEATVRLQQSHLLLSKFRDAEREFRRTTGKMERVPHLVEMRLNGEAFYYFAWRVKKTLDALSREAHLALKFEPVGVLTVRNHLIEHPDGRNGKYAVSFKIDCPEGFVLDPVGLDGFGLDKGLYPNAEEFIDKLLKKLTACPLITTPKGGP